MQSTTIDEVKLVRRVKIGIGIMLAVFVVQLFSRTPEYWPITRWEMYSRVGPPPAQYADYEMHISDTSGAVHILHTADLGFKGYEIIEEAFDDKNEAAVDTYRALLGDRVQRALPAVTVAEIEVWRNHWDIDATAVPPYTPDQPDEQTLIGAFPVAFYARSIPADASVDLHFGEDLGLLEFQLISGHQLRACDQLWAHTGWRALDAPALDYQITLALSDASGMGRAQSDGPLANSLTSGWQPDAEYLDRRVLTIPCDLPAGSYNLLVGLYDPATVQNLPVTYPDGSPYGALAYLTTIEILESDS